MSLHRDISIRETEILQLLRTDPFALDLLISGSCKLCIHVITTVLLYTNRYPCTAGSSRSIDSSLILFSLLPGDRDREPVAARSGPSLLQVEGPPGHIQPQDAKESRSNQRRHSSAVNYRACAIDEYHVQIVFCKNHAESVILLSCHCSFSARMLFYA